MTESIAALVIGAGPAGTSAAIALRERGVRVHMVDGGTRGIALPPDGDMLSLRLHSSRQADWQIGRAGETFAADAAASPKVRVPGFSGIFEGYAKANALNAADSFHLRGALAAGGLSNAWGCGVARFDDQELGALSADRAQMHESYARVSRRIGLSGASDDALRDYFGLDEWSDEALPLDSLHERLWARRKRLGDAMALGRARVAVLNHDREGRQACDRSGMCLWGCTRRATWSAAMDVAALRRDPEFVYEQGIRVTSLHRQDDGVYAVRADGPSGPILLKARSIFLAAGTIASTRLALTALPRQPAPLILRSNPIAAFLMWMPGRFGTPRERAFGLAQLSFALRANGASVFGNLFSTGGLPVSEFLTHLPVPRRAGLPLLRVLLASSVVGNVFFPGELSQHEVSLDSSANLLIKGRTVPELSEITEECKRNLASSFRKLGAWMLPGSFVSPPMGADLHYAGTLPIAKTPEAHQCRLNGELASLPGLYVVDGASLPTLPAKAHTLTIMANADRIGRAAEV